MPSSATSRDTSFETPEPITATVHVEAGSIHLVATDRTDTTVEVVSPTPVIPSSVCTWTYVRLR
ncbi:hypothetical protein ACWIFK_17870, partial [Streptomyces althioticus]